MIKFRCNMDLRRIFLLVCCLACVRLPAADTLAVHTRWKQALWERARVADLAYLNPASRAGLYSRSFTELSVGGLLEYARMPACMETGGNDQSGQVAVNSFIHIPKGALWGAASYTNGRTDDVLFNETSDYELLYPYVMGDSVGGSLFGQAYRFSGGFSRRLGQWHVGAEGRCRAFQQYRQRDPRPSNLVTEIDASAGGARSFGGRYQLGLYLTASRYKQTNSLKFFNETGVPNVLHFTGLGTDYYRFRGSNYDTYYQGYRLGGGANLLPLGVAGWFAAADYGFWTFEKIISSLNELPMAAVCEHRGTLEIGYGRKSDSRMWQMGMSAMLRERIGRENIFGDATDNIYPQIAAMDMYRHRHLQAELSSLWGWCSLSGGMWTLHPHAGYRLDAETYAYPARAMRLQHVYAGLDASWTHVVRRWGFDTRAAGTFYLATSHELQMPETVTTWDAPVYRYYDMHARSYGLLSVQETVTYSWNPAFACFLKCRYAFGTDGGIVHAAMLSVGAMF